MTDGQLFLKAIKEGDADRVEAMVDKSPELAQAKDDNGISAVLTAAYYRQSTVLELLLALDLTLDIWEAAATGESERVAELIAQEPGQVNAISSDGFYPLGLSAFFGHVDVLHFLLMNGADADRPAQNPTEVRPIHSAVAFGQQGVSLAMVTELIDHGADVNATQQGGWTPLHQAAAHGQVDLVQMLLSTGADSNNLSNDGKTPLDMARENQQEDVINMLTTAGS
jgi:ankyrin repeat protein